MANNQALSKYGALFGAAAATSGVTTNTGVGGANDRVPAKFWVNIGMVAQNIVAGEAEPRFISLQQGIPLDTQERFTTNTRNEVFNIFNMKRNEFYDQMLELAKSIPEGEAIVLPSDSPVKIQIRHAAPKVDAEPVAPESNMFGGRIDLLGSIKAQLAGETDDETDDESSDEDVGEEAPKASKKKPKVDA